MTEWTKLPALAVAHVTCLHCGSQALHFPLENVLAVGFGYAALERDGEPIYMETKEGDLMTGAEAEELAADDPDHDWRIVLEGPLSGRTYQRHGPNQWVLVAQNKGFA